jgi:hemoglobin-like flavoprotein
MNAMPWVVEPPDAEQVKLVRASWRKLSATGQRAQMVQCFYDRLFELDPAIRDRLFRDTDIVQQGKKLEDTLSFVVKGLDHFEFLVPSVGLLGERHTGYGVTEAHYDLLRQALLDALGATLGDQFGSAECDAWRATYDALAGIMKQGPAAASAGGVAGK